MTETTNLTFEQKEDNKNYILNNLDKYIVDDFGDFFHISKGYGEEYFYLTKEAVNDYEEILYLISEMILKSGDWELVYFDNDGLYPTDYKNKKTDRTIKQGVLGWGNDKFIIGEFGYRGDKNISGRSIWGNYDRERSYIMTAREDKRKNRKKPTVSNPEEEGVNSQDENLKEQFEEKRKKTEEKIKDPSPSSEPKQKPENQHNPFPNQDQSTEPTNKDNPPPPPSNQETNSSLSTPTDIQTSYNLDKDKSTIENNPTLTTPEKKESAQELLKLTITAELLVKEQKFNQKTLSQLIKEKEQNTPAYQILNKEGRIEQVIQQLQSIQKVQKDKDKEVDNKQQPISPSTKLSIGGGVIILIVFAFLISKVKKRKK